MGAISSNIIAPFNSFVNVATILMFLMIDNEFSIKKLEDMVYV